MNKTYTIEEVGALFEAAIIRGYRAAEVHAGIDTEVTDAEILEP